MIKPLIHIGYAKAASTTIQTVLGRYDLGFGAGPEPRNYSGNEVSSAPYRDLILAHPVEFHPETLKALAQERLSWTEQSNHTPVIASERYAGHWYLGGHDAFQTADRLKATWPDARILICFRRQDLMIHSVYRHYVKRGGMRSLNALINPWGTGVKGTGPRFSLLHFEFDHLVRRYRDLFGQESVLALPVELLQHSPLDFWDRLFSFLGKERPPRIDQFLETHEKVGLPVGDLALKRFLNIFMECDYTNSFSPLAGKSSQRISTGIFHGLKRTLPSFLKERAERRLLTDIENAVRGQYAASNGRLQKMVSVDLRQYGYEFSKDGDR